MFDNVIVCDRCETEGCTVKEITVTPKITMKEFIKAASKARTVAQESETIRGRQPRAFVVTCPACGKEKRFQMDSNVKEPKKVPSRSKSETRRLRIQREAENAK